MTSAATPSSGQRVVAVTGGGGGIGAAIAEELGRRGAFVVTIDPLVSLDGSERLPDPGASTAGRIVGSGGSARASALSVTDGDGIRDLFEELGRIDAVVNVAGISRPTGFAKGSGDDWRAVLSVHLDGYLNVLGAALPMMAAAGHGRILGVTSGSGWRAADAGAYSCAKRAVASITWQLGRLTPPGVVVNAISPIAVTRMVTEALARSRAAAGAGAERSSATGGLSLGGMPAPGDLGPLGAHLVDADFCACNGRALFAGGSEVALIDEPRLLEVVRTDGVTSLAHVIEAFAAGALVQAEADQSTTGGSNPRFPGIFDAEAAENGPAAAARSCGIVAHDPEVAAAVTAALEARGVACTRIPRGDDGSGFVGAAGALAAAVERAGPLDAIVVALGGGPPPGSSGDDWERVLADHRGLVEGIHADAGWARAVADHASQSDRAIRLVSVTDATSAGGRSRAQASAQLARAGRRASGDLVASFAVSMEAPPASAGKPVGELVAHLACHPEAPALSGAELVVGPGWLGLRSHPRPSGSITFGGPDLPAWFDEALRSIAG